MFHFKFSKAEGVAVGAGIGVISIVGVTWIAALSLAMTGVGVESKGVMAAPDDIGKNLAARTPRKTPRRTKANQTRKIRPAGELVLIG